MRFLFIALILGLVHTLHAQENLLPYLQNEKYGLADENGKLLVTPVYEEIAVFPGIEVVLAKSKGAWGVINSDGKVLLDFIMHGKVGSPRGAYEGIFIERIYKKILPTDSDKFLDEPLFQVTDPEHRCSYYVRPDRVTPMTDCFIAEREVWTTREGTRPPSPINTGIVKVGTQDRKINFINAKGELIFKEPVYDGEAYSAYVIAVRNESGLYALFTSRQEQLCDFRYKSVKASDDYKFIIAGQEITEGTTDRQRIINRRQVYDLYDTHGKVMLSQRSGIQAYAGRIMDTDSLGGYLRDVNGNILSFFPGARIYMNQNDTTKIGIVINEKKGLIDRDGNYLVEPVYDQLMHDYVSNQYTFDRGNRRGILDNQLKEAWSLDSVTGINYLDKPGSLYKVEKRTGPVRLSGVYTEEGKMLIPIMYDAVFFISGYNVFTVRKDSLMGLYSLDGKVILPLRIGDFDFDEASFRFLSPDTTWTYNKRFEQVEARDRLLTEFKLKKAEVTSGPPRDLQNLVNRRGEVVNKGLYREYKRIQDFSSGVWGYLAARPESEEFNDLLGEYGQVILPEGYEFNVKYVQTAVGKVAPLMVVNTEDVRAHINPPRLGLINFRGEWVIPPGKQKIGVIGNELIVVIDLETKEKRLYDRVGRYIHNKPYHYFIRSSENGIDHDRIIVGVPTDPKAYEGYMKMVGTGYALDPDAGILLGAINGKGEEIIQPKYLELDPFRGPYTCAKARNANGEIYYAIVDVNGNETFRTDRELKHFESDTTIKFSYQNKLGLVTTTGKVLIEPIYKEMRFDDGFAIVKDSVQSYVIPIKDPSEGFSMGPGEYVNIETIDENYFAVENHEYPSEGTKKSLFRFFTKDGKFLSSVENQGKDSPGTGWKLPSGFITIYDSPSSRPYVFNYRTGMKLKG